MYGYARPLSPADFNAPVQRCLGRLHDAKWANSDILLVRWLPWWHMRKNKEEGTGV